MARTEWIELFVGRSVALRSDLAEPDAIRRLAESLYPIQKDLDPWVAAELEMNGTLGNAMAAARPAAQGETDQRKSQGSRRKFIVVADDYDHAAMMVARLLEVSTAYDSAAAKDGDEALEHCQRRRPDAVLLDIDMPRIGGIEAAQRLHQMFADDRPLLIGMTGSKQGTTAWRSGVFDHLLTKPVDFERLFELLDRLD